MDTKRSKKTGGRISVGRPLKYISMLLLACALPAANAARDYANVPLFWAEGVKPNVVLAVDDSGSMEDEAGSSKTPRMAILKDVARQVIEDNYKNMNIGLFSFDGTSGKFLAECGADKKILLDAIGTYTVSVKEKGRCPSGTDVEMDGKCYDWNKGLNPGGGTPLTEQLFGVLKYFKEGASRNINNKSTYFPSPIQYRCQKNFVVTFSDGEQSTNYSEKPPTAFAHKAIDNPWGANNSLSNSSGSWDGYADPKVKRDQTYTTYLDDVAQFGYDIDFKSTTDAAVSGCPDSSAGTDCAGKSWDDRNFLKQNVITYSIGFNVETEILRDVPLVDRRPVTRADVRNNMITIPNHGLQTNDYVQYYAPTTTRTIVLKGLGYVSGQGNNVIVSPEEVPATGTAVAYNAQGGQALQYQETYISVPAVPEHKKSFLTSAGTSVKTGASDEYIQISNHGFNTGDYVQYKRENIGAASIGGLSFNSWYYIAKIADNRFRLATSAENAQSCVTDTSKCINLSGGPTLTHSFTRPAIPAQTSIRPTSQSTYFIVRNSDNTFQLALSKADAEANPAKIVTIVNGGNANQTFTYNASAAIGGLTGFVTDAESDTNGKYCVERVDADRIKLYTSRPNANKICGTAQNTFIPITPGEGIFSIGPGKAYFSYDKDTLSEALNAAFMHIDSQTLSASAVAANSSEFTTGNFVYQARFNTGDWSGDVVAMAITDTGINIQQPTWSAAQKITATNRTVLTHNGTAGRVFNWNNLTADQKAALRNNNAITDAQGQKVVNWLLGQTVTDDSLNFRARNRGLLGDIINSNPAFVGANNDEGYGRVTQGGSTYAAYVQEKATLRPNGMLVVGANDGMLHVFDGATGQERLAFIPNAVYKDVRKKPSGTTETDYKLFHLTQKYYGQESNPHRYFVDGSPTVGDAYINGAWTTMIVGGLSSGGKSIYAIDARDTTFAAADIKWEFTNADLGYTYSQPVIGKLEDGTWVAIFGNGYDGADGQAYLFVVNLANGALIGKIKAGNVEGGENGLSSPAVRFGGADRKSIVAVYAGDLAGNVWVFRGLSGTGGGTSSLLFKAEDSEGAQPFTAKPTVQSFNGGTLVHIGSGKYFETIDKSYDPQNSEPVYNAMYTIFDDGTGTTVTKDKLVEQWINKTVLGEDAEGEEMSFFAVTNNEVDYNIHKGWYINFVYGGTESASGKSYAGERHVTEPVVVGPRLMFTTIIPEDSDQCQGGGSSRFFELNSTTGAMISKRILDTNGDGVIDEYDDIVAGLTYQDGILSKPQAMTKPGENGNTIEKIFGSTNLNTPLFVLTNAGVDCNERGDCPDIKSGRMSWRQLR